MVILDLQGRIVPARSATTVATGKHEVTLKMYKEYPGVWGRLLVDLPRKERLKRRDESRAAAEAAAQADVERKKTKKWDDSRFALKQQMDHDRAQRELAGSDIVALYESESPRLARYFSRRVAPHEVLDMVHDAFRRLP